MNIKRMLIFMILITLTAAGILIYMIATELPEEINISLVIEEIPPIVVELPEVCGTDPPTEQIETLHKAVEVDQTDLQLLAIIGDLEAGATWCTDETQMDVMSVVINRVNDPEYPNTIEGVIYQKGQYSTAGRVKGHSPSERAIRNARTVLTEGVTLPEETVFQANFRQGVVVKEEQGLFFGRRTKK